jgi:heavy metal translocating P-type ATPase
LLPLWIVIGVGGVPLLAAILRKLLKRDYGADALAAVALVVAAVLADYVTAALIVLMLSGGQALETYAKRKASNVLQALSQRMPLVAHKKQNNQIEDIDLTLVAIGDTLVIHPHETAPVDGTVIEGHGAMDESYLTGEPYRVSKAPGANVLSGAINGDSVLVVRCDKQPSDSRYASIMTVMEEAEKKRPSIQRLGDQIGTIFTPVALVVAGLAWWLSGDVVRFLAVLVIATPCPLLIAIPITLISAISTAAKLGIIIKDPSVLEQLPTCRTAIFDKTGTLTYGQPSVTDIVTAEGVASERVLQLTASLEQYSKHPLATAIVQAAQAAHLFLPQATEVSELAGKGLTGVIDNQTVQLTSRKKLADSHPQCLPLLPETTSGLECVVLIDNAYAATLRFHDAPRSDSPSFIHHLKPAHQFEKVMLVSGDRESEVNYFATLVGIKEVRASQSPEQKLAIVREETAKAPTLFMGDGVNDAPALTAATVGLAFGLQTNVAAEAAGAVILESTLTKVDELMHLSMAMRQIALQSAVGGMLLSVIGMGFAAAGLISPVSGAIFQEIIDVLAILNALRLVLAPPVKTDL